MLDFCWPLGWEGWREEAELIQSLLPFLLVWMALLMLYCTGVAMLGGSHCSGMGEMPFSDSGCALPEGNVAKPHLTCFYFFLALFILITLFYFFSLPEHL